MRLTQTDTLPHPDSVLPFFRWMNSGNEGGVGYAIPPRTSTSSSAGDLGDALPAYLLNESNVMQDSRDKVLPWRLKDGWTLEHSEVEHLMDPRDRGAPSGPPGQKAAIAWSPLRRDASGWSRIRYHCVQRGNWRLREVR